LTQERNLPGSDESIQNTDTELIAHRSAVYFEDMLEASALETDDTGVVNKVVLEEKNEIHGRAALKI
jgi:hypothetical protein